MRERVLLAQMDHLRAGIGLLVIVGDGDGIEFADRVVAAQNAARIFPGDGRTGFDLRPGNLGMRAAAIATLGDEIVDAAQPILVAGIPVLHRRIFDLGVIERHQFDHGGMQLVLVALGRGAAFEIGDVRALVGDDQRAFELAGLARIDAEIGGKLHRAAHALGDVDKSPVGKHRRIQRGEEIVVHRHDRAEIFPHQIGIVADRFGDRTENHARFVQLVLEGRGDRNGIEHRIDRDARQQLSARESGMPSFS